MVDRETDRLIDKAAGGCAPDRAAAFCLADAPLEPLMRAAENLTLAGFGRNVSYSRKVFIPLTELCRNVCHYCTFAKAPRRVASPYLSPAAVLDLARAGRQAGCKEALFTLGDQPERRYAAARQALGSRGLGSTLEYLEQTAGLVLRETGLLPHLNPGVMDRAQLERLRPVAASMGIMLETVSERLSQRGGPHFGSPDKWPARRLETLRLAGELAIPFTSGLLIGIGETRHERISALLCLRELHDEYGHLQELIIQNFRAKPGTQMAHAPEPALEEHLWTIAVARLLFGTRLTVQAPPNLRADDLEPLIRAGVNDWGGVSPVTTDHVNPEAPWPHLDDLARQTEAAGRRLVERLALAAPYTLAPARWVDAGLASLVLRQSDGQGLARTDDWYAGAATALPVAATRWSGPARRVAAARNTVTTLLSAVQDGREPDEAGIAMLFACQGDDRLAVFEAADQVRRSSVGDGVTYVVNRNINYTNICVHRCGFCAFSKGHSSRGLRGPAYDLDLEEVARRTVEAAEFGATEVCLQGGIHPTYTGDTYLNIVAAVKAAVPGMHVHAFSPLEIRHGARTLGLSLETYLARLRRSGLSTLPGTAAEILDDEVRAIICPDKLLSEEWLEVMRIAHGVGLRSTATIMFGHVDQPRHWARHLLRIRKLQAETGGFTEFVPLPFVHMEAPLWRRGRARPGPTLSEAVLMHAIARLSLHPLVPNVQTSWVKMGTEAALLCLDAGANDLGGTLMNESITRSAGGVNGQLLGPREIEALAHRIGRPVRQRTTLYGQLAGTALCAAGVARDERPRPRVAPEQAVVAS
ncbi:MAG: 7,8-didemethyl-8-hydroxy-5-deazariboflavin synthase subunit CofH [Gammaproteobacteria bacterium]|nr:7,8-didemethyl-8-hydroxy-5-deazariboflavin synthase subunit CofH [Gammaproteobacteria bacterium]